MILGFSSDILEFKKTIRHYISPYLLLTLTWTSTSDKDPLVVSTWINHWFVDNRLKPWVWLYGCCWFFGARSDISDESAKLGWWYTRMSQCNLLRKIISLLTKVLKFDARWSEASWCAKLRLMCRQSLCWRVTEKLDCLLDMENSKSINTNSKFSLLKEFPTTHNMTFFLSSQSNESNFVNDKIR